MCDFSMKKILEQIRMISMNFWTHFPSFSFIMVIFIHTNRYTGSRKFSYLNVLSSKDRKIAAMSLDGAQSGVGYDDGGSPSEKSEQMPNY